MERIKHNVKKIWIKNTGTAVSVFLLLLFLSGCGRTKPLEYTLSFSGTAEQSGVVSFLNYAINVYQDEASNSCGDCADQPAHLYVGASAADAATEAAKAVSDADDLWTVQSVEGGTVVLKEKEAGTVSKKNIPVPEVPSGMTVTDNYGNTSSGEGDVETGSQEKIIYGLDGEEIRVPVQAERLAAVYGPSYEALVVLGQEDKIVVCADVQKDNFPWARKIFSRMNDLPCLNNAHTSVNMEELMVYKPDLVFSFSRPNELRQLQESGVYAVPGTTTRTLEEVPKQLLIYVRALGSDAVERAKDYESYFNEKLQYVKEKTAGLSEEEKPTVYYAGIDLLTTYGKYSDIPELIETAGGTAVTGELEAGNHTQISFEQLAAWNPSYIFIDHGGMNEGDTVEQMKEEAESSAQYSKIQAVKDGQIYLTPSGVFYWDMGLQKILLLMHMVKTIHPDLFASLDMKTELQEFYSRFYGYDLTAEEAGRILAREDPAS